MKTPMQELIEWLGIGIRLDTLDVETARAVRTVATDLLEKEKQTIIDVYNEGCGHGSMRKKTTGEIYFNTTFNQTP